MLKVRLQGTKENIEWFCGLLKSSPQIEVIQMSEIYTNKGTNKYYRLYAEIKRVEFKENK